MERWKILDIIIQFLNTHYRRKNMKMSKVLNKGEMQNLEIWEGIAELKRN